METDHESSIIDYWKKFHMKKDGKTWSTDEGREMHLRNKRYIYLYTIRIL